MLTFKDLAAVVKTAVGYERKLKDLYDVAEIALRKPESKQVVARLRDRLVAKLEVLEHVDPARYGKPEFMKYAPALDEADLLEMRSITRDSTPQQIYSHMVRFEEKLRDFYQAVSARIVGRDQKELFDSLVAFKEEQIAEIKRLMAA